MAPPPAKRSCSSLRARNSGMPSHNRVYRRIIIRDPGRPINEASSRVAVIKGFIGTISSKYDSIYINDILLTCLGHKSLLNAGILHRNVSIGNIMLTEKEDDSFLIDLDFAIRTIDNQSSGTPSKTGTKIFIAIGALLGDSHSFMYDLESFFWVLFWIYIYYDSLDEKGKVKRKIVPKYEKWNYADTEELAETKTGQISNRNFNTVDENFTEHCKLLVLYIRDLHKVVFPNGSPWSIEH